MNTLDIIILIILLIGGLNGLRQGFIKAFANLVGWIFALIVGAKYAVILAPAMSSLSQDPVEWPLEKFETGSIKSFSRWRIWFPERFTDCFGHHAGRWSVGGKLTTLETVQICTNPITLCTFSNRNL